MSEESQNQQLDDSVSAAMPAQKCPLEPSTFLGSLRSKGLRFLEEIEVHISASKCHHPPLKGLTLHGSLDGTTPLLLACYFGDLECVKHIVENWHVDFQAARVYYHGFLSKRSCFESASPLFVAAFNGHIDIVRYLVGLGADVSSKSSREIEREKGGMPFPYRRVSTTRWEIKEQQRNPRETFCYRSLDRLTPLRGAIQQSRHHSKSLAVVRFLLESGADPSALHSTKSPIWQDPSCGVDITTALIQHGLNLNQQNVFGETILHHWTYHSFFDYPNLNRRDVFGNPILDQRSLVYESMNATLIRARLAVVELLVNSGADVMARDDSGFTPLLRAASECRYAVVDFLATIDYTDRMEIIDAMEMAAAKILWKISNRWNSEQESQRAFGYLRKALDLRQIGSLPMTPLKLKRGRTIGWTTAAQLDQVIEQPAEYILQSYLIQLRICSDRCWKGIRSFRGQLLNCIRCLKEQNRLDDLIDVLWATLEKMQLPLLDSHREHKRMAMADDVVINLTWVLSQLEQDDPLFHAKTFKTIMNVAIDHDCSLSVYLPSHMDALLQLVTLLAGQPDLTLIDTNKIGSGDQARDQELSIKDLLRELVNHDSRCIDGATLLQNLACNDKNLNLAAVKLLLEANADPNAGDRYGNGTLHLLALKHHGNGEVIESVARLLLKYGAHLDMVNHDKKTAAQIWKEKNGSQDLPLWLHEPGTVPKLECLSARIIRSNNIAFTKLPEILHPFVKLH